MGKNPRTGSTFQSFLEEQGIEEEVTAEAKKRVAEFEQKLVHWLPPYRVDTYCGLNPGKERAKGKPIKTTDMRPRLTCEDCKGLPVEECVK
jgi:hypothetical protein